MKQPVNPIRETDDEARQLARRLIRGAPFAAIGVLEPETGFPFTSRVLTGTDIDGVPVILVSTLSVHTKALLADSRASLLFGEPGKGDPLAHPRITLRIRAEAVPHDSPAHKRLRERFLARHPKSALYIDFMDFGFFHMVPVSAHLNGGFGKAYMIEPKNLLIKSSAKVELANNEIKILSKLNSENKQLADEYAQKINNYNEHGWMFCGVDCAGFDIIRNHRILRVEFDREILKVAHVLNKITQF